MEKDEERVLSGFGLGFAMWDLMIQSFSKKPQKQKQFDETRRKRVHAQTGAECHRLCLPGPHGSVASSLNRDRVSSTEGHRAP